MVPFKMQCRRGDDPHGLGQGRKAGTGFQMFIGSWKAGDFLIGRPLSIFADHTAQQVDNVLFLTGGLVCIWGAAS